MRFMNEIGITGGGAADPDPRTAPEDVPKDQILRVPLIISGTDDAPTALGAILEGTAAQTADVEVYVQDEGPIQPFGSGAPDPDPADLRYYLMVAAETVTVGTYTRLVEGLITSGKVYIRVSTKPAANATLNVTPVS